MREKGQLKQGRTPRRFVVTKKTLHYPGTTRIICPYCGNDEDFFELAENVSITTRYIQNEDGSFTPVADDTQVFGKIKFSCGKCGADLTKYHKHFLEMLF